MSETHIIPLCCNILQNVINKPNEFTKLFRVAMVMGCQKMCNSSTFKMDIWLMSLNLYLDTSYVTSFSKKVISLAVNKEKLLK